MPRLTKVVLRDSDDKGRQTLAYGFASDGVVVTPAADSEELRRLAATDAPQVVVAVLHEGEKDGLAFLNALATDAQLARIPRLVLTPDALRAEVKALPGGSETLPVPTFVR